MNRNDDDQHTREQPRSKANHSSNETLEKAEGPKSDAAVADYQQMGRVLMLNGQRSRLPGRGLLRTRKRINRRRTLTGTELRKRADDAIAFLRSMLDLVDSHRRLLSFDKQFASCLLGMTTQILEPGPGYVSRQFLETHRAMTAAAMVLEECSQVPKPLLKGVMKLLEATLQGVRGGSFSLQNFKGFKAAGEWWVDPVPAEPAQRQRGAR